jgi:hypothetical protein
VFVGFVEFIELEKYLLDDGGDDKPGEDAEGTAEDVIVKLVDDVILTLALSHQGRGEPHARRPGTKDFTKPDDKGMPLLISAQKGGKSDALQKCH